MQVKRDMTKLIKLSCKFRSYYSKKTPEMFPDILMLKMERNISEKFAVLTEYSEEQTDFCISRRKISQSRSPSWRNQSHLPFRIKQMKTMPRSHQKSAT